MSKAKLYRISFRCYYDGNYTQHYQDMTLKDIPKWIEAYKFTHPEVNAITIQIRFEN